MTSTTYIEYIKLFSSVTTAAIGASLITINMLKLFTTTEMMFLAGSVVAEQLTDKASRTVDAMMGSKAHTT